MDWLVHQKLYLAMYIFFHHIWLTAEYCKTLNNHSPFYILIKKIHYEPPSFNDNNLSHQKSSSTSWPYFVLSLHMYKTTGAPKIKIENKKSDQAQERQKCWMSQNGDINFPMAQPKRASFDIFHSQLRYLMQSIVCK